MKHCIKMLHRYRELSIVAKNKTDNLQVLKGRLETPLKMSWPLPVRNSVWNIVDIMLCEPSGEPVFKKSTFHLKFRYFDTFCVHVYLFGGLVRVDRSFAYVAYLWFFCNVGFEPREHP